MDKNFCLTTWTVFKPKSSVFVRCIQFFRVLYINVRNQILKGSEILNFLLEVIQIRKTFCKQTIHSQTSKNWVVDEEEVNRKVSTGSPKL